MSLLSSKSDTYNSRDDSADRSDILSSRPGRQSGRRATVRDVAAAAGVSIGTVSRYLNGRPLLARTRVLVEKGMEETDYQDRHIPTRGKRQKTRVVGALFPNFDGFHGCILSELEKTLSRRNYHLMTAGYEDSATQMREKFAILRNRNLDGIVCSPLKSAFGIVRDAADLGIPVVTFNNRVKAWRTDHVSVDDRLAVAGGVQYLIDMNHTRIAILAGDRESTTGWDRLEGYRDALRAAGIPLRPEYVRGGEWGHLGSSSWAREILSLPEPPTAILASNYMLANGVLRYCRDNGIRIPEDVSIISFDDTDVFQLHRPAITAIRQPMEQIAEEVATLLLRRVAGDWENYPSSRTLPCEMVLRKSVRKLP